MKGSSIQKTDDEKEDKEPNFKDDVYVYTTPKFEVAGEKYSWLNNNKFIGTLDLHPKGVHLHFYRVLLKYICINNLNMLILFLIYIPNAVLC